MIDVIGGYFELEFITLQLSFVLLLFLSHCSHTNKIWLLQRKDMFRFGLFFRKNN